MWGDPKKTLPIFIEEHRLNVTENLHAALCSLRERSVEWIWVDAICINQEDKNEQSRQVRYMAKIYGKANRVLAWLGEAADNSDRAFEEIRARKKWSNSPDSEPIQQAILALLQRPWFRRIWILQEVAAARHILIMCGSAEIDGYAFCLGLRSLQVFYNGRPDLHSLVRSVTYLIRQAKFRPTHGICWSDMSFLAVCSLGNLLDMFHTHEASVLHDKVYALLGMSSDALNAADLLPDYNIKWGEVFQRLIKFLLGKEVSVETWNDREMAVIKCKGCILGRVSSIVPRSGWGDTYKMTITSKDIPGYSGYTWGWSACWNLNTSAKSVRRGDFVCLLQGASNPTIFRLCEDHFTIIMIAATPTEGIRTEGRNIYWPELFRSIETFPCDFLLIWDWEKSRGIPRNRENNSAISEAESGVRGHSKAELQDHDRATGIWRTAVMLEDLEEYSEAEERFQKAIEHCERAFGMERAYMLTSMDKLALMYKQQRQWKEAEALLVQGSANLGTSSGSVSQSSTCRDPRLSKEADELQVMALLLKWRAVAVQVTEAGSIATAETRRSGKVAMMLFIKRIKEDVQIEDEVVVQIARLLDEEVIALLLERRGEDIQITEGVVEAATGNRNSGKAIMMILIKRLREDVQITDEVVVQIARSFDEEVMALLLERRGNDVRVTEMVVKGAARNERNGKEVMAFLLERRRDQVRITVGVAMAAGGNGKCGKAVMMLLIERAKDDVQISEWVVFQIARLFDEEVMALLLERRGNDMRITEMVVKGAARNERNGKEVMALLLERRGDHIQLTEGVVRAAGGNRRCGKAVMMLLIERAKDN